jgi:putative heme-binding domain-containing protein
LAGEPDKGRELFFDAADDLNCAQCHRVRGAGGTVGPDLSGLADRPGREILRDIVLPEARLSSQHPLFKLTTAAGERLTVVKAGEDGQRIQVYDVTALPPVRRTMDRDQVQALEPQPGSPMPGTYGQRYTLKQLLDLVSFLKAAGPGSSSTVTLEDLLGEGRGTR